MSQKFEERLSEIFNWYVYNKKLIPRENLAKRLDFQEKVIDCLFELVVLQAASLQAVELRSGVRSSKLYLPNGVEIKGDLTRFG